MILNIPISMKLSKTRGGKGIRSVGVVGPTYCVPFFLPHGLLLLVVHANVVGGFMRSDRVRRSDRGALGLGKLLGQPAGRAMTGFHQGLGTREFGWYVPVAAQHCVLDDRIYFRKQIDDCLNCTIY